MPRAAPLSRLPRNARTATAAAKAGPAAPPPLVLRPQPGPQEAFLSTGADIAIAGGAAGVGKSFALLLDAVRHVEDSAFSAVYFRRESTQIRNPGGLWDSSMEIFPHYGSEPHESVLEHRFPAGGTVKFAHLEHGTSVYAWDGSQIPVIGFDQLEHFSKAAFFYMMSRNRDPSGHIRPYIRATCNPDPDSFLAEFLSWWIDQEERLSSDRLGFEGELLRAGDLNPYYGYPIPERANRTRWMLRDGDDVIWGDSHKELFDQYRNPAWPDDDPRQPRPLSVCFIPGTIFDNKILLERDPGYLSKLQGLDRVSRARLLGDPKLGGNWKVRASAGLLFRREWCKLLPVAPTDLEAVVRGWDLAATEEQRQGKDRKIAWSVGVKLGRYRRRSSKDPSRFVVLDVQRTQSSPSKVEALFVMTTQIDGRLVRSSVPQDPGQAGKAQVERFAGLVPGFDIRTSPETGDKVIRFNPFSAQAEAGNVDVVMSPSVDAYLASLEAFPDAGKDDADATSRAFDELLNYAGQIDMSGAGAAGGEAGQDSGVLLQEGSPWAM